MNPDTPRYGHEEGQHPDEPEDFVFFRYYDNGENAPRAVLRTRAAEPCSPPRPGDVMWRGDRRGYVGVDGRWQPTPVRKAPAGLRIRDWLVDVIFCGSCLRLRAGLGHFLFCHDRRRDERDRIRNAEKRATHA